MSDDPNNILYEYAELAFHRWQARDLLKVYLEESDPTIMHELVEGLVFEGVQSISVLREILDEVRNQKVDMHDELHKAFSDLDHKLKEYKVSLANVHTPHTLLHLTPSIFIAYLREQGVNSEVDQFQCLQLMQDSNQLMAVLLGNLNLLDDLENYIQDWFNSLVYHSAHQGWEITVTLRGKSDRTQ